MSDGDLRQLRSLLREALAHSPLSARALESTLGIGHGNLSHLLAGRLELRVRHLLSIAHELGVPPHQFLELGCPEALTAARRDLSDLTRASLPGERMLAFLRSDPCDLDRRIRAIVREELNARLGEAGGEGGLPGERGPAPPSR
jgi:transcriptional regulator with XRE-family HTH domain